MAQGKKDILDGIADGSIKPVAVEAIEIGAAPTWAHPKRTIIVPDNGKIQVAYPDLKPTEVTVRWHHPAERAEARQSGHVWLDADGSPVVVHGECFGVFPLADVLVLSDEPDEFDKVLD
jgi:hypothetical protein